MPTYRFRLDYDANGADPRNGAFVHAVLNMIASRVPVGKSIDATMRMPLGIIDITTDQPSDPKAISAIIRDLYRNKLPKWDVEVEVVEPCPWSTKCNDPTKIV